MSTLARIVTLLLQLSECQKQSEVVQYDQTSTMTSKMLWVRCR